MTENEIVAALIDAMRLHPERFRPDETQPMCWDYILRGEIAFLYLDDTARVRKHGMQAYHYFSKQAANELRAIAKELLPQHRAIKDTSNAKLIEMLLAA